METIEYTMTDLQHDGTSWLANGCWCKRVSVPYHGTETETTLFRRACALLGARGFRKEYPGFWRNGSIGIFCDMD